MCTKTSSDCSKMMSSYCFYSFGFALLCQSLNTRISSEMRNIYFTILGFSCVVLSPCPSLPYSPRPHVYSSPLEVIAALWELPQAISRIRLVFSASISLGLSQFLKTVSKEYIIASLLKELHNTSTSIT